MTINTVVVVTIYLNLLYSRNDTGHFFRRTSATLLTDSAGDVTTSNRNNQMKYSNYSIISNNQIIQLLFFDYQNNRMILIIEIMVTDIFTKSKSIKLFEKLRVILIYHWVLN
jgi:hypothetical protein